MEALGSSETSVTIFQCTRLQFQEEKNLNFQSVLLTSVTVQNPAIYSCWRGYLLLSAHWVSWQTSWKALSAVYPRSCNRCSDMTTNGLVSYHAILIMANWNVYTHCNEHWVCTATYPRPQYTHVGYCLRTIMSWHSRLQVVPGCDPLSLVIRVHTIIIGYHLNCCNY